MSREKAKSGSAKEIFLDSGCFRWMKSSERHWRACTAWARGERRFATGFAYGTTYDKANDERCKRLLEKFDKRT
jgi:hypothetical protein